MNGLLLALVLTFLSCNATQNDEESDQEKPLILPQIYVERVETAHLPYVQVYLGNASCPPQSAFGIYAAVQLYTVDEVAYEYYASVKCDAGPIASNLELAIKIEDDEVAYYPVGTVVYIDYATIYVWLAETSSSGYADSAIQTNQYFEYPPPDQRPFKTFFDFTRKISQECHRSRETFDMINFPLVFRNGGRLGTVVTFENFTAPELQAEMRKNPRLSIETTLYLTENCVPRETTVQYCSIYHASRTEIDDEDTPQLFLAKYTNELVLQVVDFENPNGLFTYRSEIFLEPGFAYRILLSIESFMYRLNVQRWDPLSANLSDFTLKEQENWFDNQVKLNAISWPGTYLVIGGSDSFATFPGLVDRFKVYRTRYLKTFENLRPKMSTLSLELISRMKFCEKRKLEIETSPANSFKKQPKILFKNENYSTILQKLEQYHDSDLFEQLSLAGCSGSGQAEFLLGVLKRFSIIETPSENYLANYLRAALLGDHFADLALGNHLLKNQLDVEAFRYLKSSADYAQRMTQKHSAEDRWVDSIHLNNEKELETHQDNDDGPVIAWLLHQAGYGDVGAMHDVARLFYLGAQGVDRQMERAADLFRQAAMLDPDPEILYDYGIVLLHGRGVDKNLTLAMEYLQRAADKDYAAAVGALGWIHMEAGNLTAAIPYLERAAELGVPEAAHNIGYMLINDLHPLKPGKRVGLAYGYFTKAAGLGSLEGALMAGEIAAKGIPSIDLAPNVTEACRFEIYVANQSPRLGSPLRAALSSYLEGDMRKSFLHYAIAAETGNDVALFNAGFLCEMQSTSLTASGILRGDPTDISRKCAKMFYELTTTRPFSKVVAAPTHALLWLARDASDDGDFAKSAELYADALLAGADEGYYGLAWLAAQKGYHIPVDVFYRLIITGDWELAESLAAMTPVDVALFFLDACMTIEEKAEGEEFDESGYLSLDGRAKSLPEGYWSCAIFKLYVVANKTFHEFVEENAEIAQVLSGHGELLGAWRSFWSFHLDGYSFVGFFVIGFIVGVFAIYPLLAFLGSKIATIFRS